MKHNSDEDTTEQGHGIQARYSENDTVENDDDSDPFYERKPSPRKRVSGKRPVRVFHRLVRNYDLREQGSISVKGYAQGPEVDVSLMSSELQQRRTC